MACSTLAMPSILETFSSSFSMICKQAAQPTGSQELLPLRWAAAAAAGCPPDLHCYNGSSPAEIKDYYEFLILQYLKLLEGLQFSQSHVAAHEATSSSLFFSASHDQTPSNPLVEWRSIETSMEDGLLCRAAVTKTQIRKDQLTSSFKADQQTEITDKRELPLLSDVDQNLFEETQASSEKDLTCQEEDKHIINQKFGAKELVAVEDGCNGLVRRRRMATFPPLLPSLQEATPPLRRIRSEGRFVLQKMEVESQLVLQTIRQDGRLMFNLFKHVN